MYFHELMISILQIPNRVNSNKPLNYWQRLIIFVILIFILFDINTNVSNVRLWSRFKTSKMALNILKIEMLLGAKSVFRKNSLELSREPKKGSSSRRSDLSELVLNFYYSVNIKQGIMFLPFLHNQQSFSFIE